MKLRKLLESIKIKKLINFKDLNIKSLCHNSKLAEKNSLFFCIKGQLYDGNNFIYDAIKNGAIACVTDKVLDINITQIIVEDVRIAMSLIASNFYENAHREMKIISVVGTNGKTTITHIIFNILRTKGLSVGLIGTNGIYINELFLPTELTTPDPIDLHYAFKQFKAFNVEYVVMEASAQAIYYNKLYGIENEICIFTNITNEHLDFFKTMENYAKIKMDYVMSNCNKYIVLNVDDNFGKIMSLNAEKNSNRAFSTYGIYNPATTFAVDIVTSMKGSSFYANSFDEVFKINTKLVGDFNVYNILSAISACKLLNIDNKSIINGISSMERVAGRFNVFEMSKNRKIVVDFAHTPDGFIKTLSLIKLLRKGKIFIIFGCVGYSDAIKRAQMGKIASEYANLVILTQDNPNYASFEEICADIKADSDENKFVSILDRASAIRLGMEILHVNDTLVILGKGAENYNLIKGERVIQSDLSLVEKYLLLFN